MDIQGTYLNIIKAIYDKPTANIIFNDEKLKGFPLKSRTRQGYLLSPLLLSILLEVPATEIKARNERYPNGKRRGEMSIHADGMILYTENLKDSTQNTLELINEFCNSAE